MIIDLILLVLQGVLNIILAPLTVLNITIDFISSIPVITSFIQFVAYVLPWDNLMPLIDLLIAIFTFRIALTLIRTILSIAFLKGA